MWAFCSDVCTCTKSEAAIKADASAVKISGKTNANTGQEQKGIFSDEDYPMPIGGKKNRLTVTGKGAVAGQEDTAEAQGGQPQLGPAPQGAEWTTEGADLPPAVSFPTPKNLAKECQSQLQIFDTAKHEFCVFGFTNHLRGPHCNDAKIEPEFEEKNLTFSGANTEAELRTVLQSLGIAINCKKGKKPEQPNQDNVFFCKMGDISICGVADGHGPDGHWASHWAARFMMKLLMMEVSTANALPGDEALQRIFDTVHQAVQIRSTSDRFDLNMSGSTLSTCVIDHSNKIAVSAWVGDSRCALGIPGGLKGGSFTIDHKPQDVPEKKRIKAAGGEVVRLENDVPHRVFVRGGDVPGLAMSRAVGDLIAHSVGVIHEPGITRAKLEDHFVLCCSDGVWEFIESEEATEMVSKVGRQNVSAAMEALTKESRKRWISEEETITDDISAICIWV